MTREYKDKELANYFLNNSIDREEFDELYTLILEILGLIEFKDIDKKFSNFNMEISNDKDNIYKNIKIKNPQICG